MRRLIIAFMLAASPAVAQNYVGPLQSQNGLSEIYRGGPSVRSQARLNLGLGTASTHDAGDFDAAGTAAALLAPYLTSATAASTYAPLASPTFTGTPTVPGYLTSATAASTYLTPSGSITATGGTTARSLGDRAAEVLNVMDYGAKCDSSTDDAAAINATLSQARAIFALSSRAAITIALPQSIPGHFRRCLIGSTLNFTGLYGTAPFGVTYQGNGTILYSTIAGAPIIDALGSNRIHWHELKVQSAGNATYGVQIGRTLTTGSDYGGGAGMDFDNMELVGTFTIAGFYNFASEEVTYHNPRVSNSYNSAGSYALVEDGFNHFNITSAFVTETAPTDTAQSFEENTFFGGSFASSGGSVVSPVWLGAVTQHRFINTYFLNSTGSSCVTLYNASAGGYMGIKGLDLDIHCETATIATPILIAGTLASPIIRDLTFREVYEFATSSVFALSGSATSATLEHLKVNISGGPASPTFTVFDNPVNYVTTGAEIYLYAAAPWTSSGQGPNNFSGYVSLPGVAGMQTNAALVCASGSISPATHNTRDWQSSVSCTTTLSGETSGSSGLRLTTDQAAANATNCVNIPSPLGSLATGVVNIVARDRTSTTNYAAWQSYPIVYGNTAGAGANTFVTAGTKPTPVTGGTVTGTDVSVTADTTNGCLNITWTPPTSNTDLWDVTASVAYTLVR